MMIVRCGDCVLWDPQMGSNEALRGRCQLNPPVYLPETGGLYGQPVTLRTEGCAHGALPIYDNPHPPELDALIDKASGGGELTDFEVWYLKETFGEEGYAEVVG